MEIPGPLVVAEREIVSETQTKESVAEILTVHCAFERKLKLHTKSMSSSVFFMYLKFKSSGKATAINFLNTRGKHPKKPMVITLFS